MTPRHPMRWLAFGCLATMFGCANPRIANPAADAAVALVDGGGGPGCEAEPSPCDSVPEAPCENRADGFSCACPDGFGGDGVGEAGCVPYLLDLSLRPAALNEPFSSTLTAYSARVTPWLTELSFRAEAPGGSSLEVLGSSMAASTWTELPLVPGASSAPVTVRAGGAARTYDVTLKREPAFQYLKADHPGYQNEFGFALALDGDLLAVAAARENSDGNPPTNMAASRSGAVYLFRRDALGRYVQEAYLKAGVVVPDAQFGWSVALQGSRLVVGSPTESTDGVRRDVAGVIPKSGAVHVFDRDVSGRWVETAYLKSPEKIENQVFGLAVALDGDTLVVGAPRQTQNPPAGDLRDAGTAYVYRLQETGAWELEGTLHATGGAKGDEFGVAVSISEERLAVTAPKEDGSGAETSGATYVFERTQGAWTQAAYLKPQVVSSNMLFGWAVSLRGERVVVGAPREVSSIGAAYVFERQANGSYRQAARLAAPVAGPQEFFGRALSLDDTGTLLAVGADEYLSTSSRNGRVAVYRRTADGAWSITHWSESPSPDREDQFGYAVSASGGRVAVGARLEDSATVADPESDSQGESGAAWVLE